MKKILLLALLPLAFNAYAQITPSAVLTQRLSPRTLDEALRLIADLGQPVTLELERNQGSKPNLPNPNALFDLISLEDSTYTWTWDADAASWVYDSKTIDVQYDANNNLLGYRDQEWDGLNWVNTRLVSYTHDASNNLTSYTSKNWDGSMWVNNIQLLYTYDGDNNITSSTIQLGNLDTWMNLLRSMNTYDANHNLLLSIIEQWDGAAWVNFNQSLYTYDGQNLTQQIDQVWDGTTWVNSKQTTITYTQSQKNTVIQNWNGTVWVNSSSNLLVYDTNDNLIYDINATWNVILWVNDYSFSYTYDANNNRTSELYQTWNGSDWENYERTLYSYDPNNNLTINLVQLWVGEWIDYNVYTYSYSEDNFLVSNTFKGLDDLGGTSYGDSTVYYFHTVTGLHDENSGRSEITIYPNPSRGSFSVTSESEISSVRVYNLVGNLIYTNDNIEKKSFEGINILSQGAGIYFVLVQEGGKVFSQKIVVY